MSHRNQMAWITAALLLGAGLGASACANAQAQAHKKVYCWNENGRKICSDALPAEAANAARTEISASSGLATGQVARALTESERAAAAVSATVARRQAEAVAMQQRQDLAMVESYMTEADLRRAYGERTSLLDETLKASQLGLSNQRLSLITLLRQAGDWELDKKPVPKRLADSILHQHNDLIRQQQILADQQQDRATLDAELVDAVRRYRDLKASEADNPANPGSQDPLPAR
ncbi:hypothetical protein [Thermomonas sp.]|uniref:hypothetical protein n=1 Tax=Thermomonas sp. TaxID=1971895 RepID=UPI002486FB91|nr:hypothetical protein [Thermomonas sp.]MDI1252460.1 hypothetical protein [Thermomonas sp.]